MGAAPWLFLRSRVLYRQIEARHRGAAQGEDRNHSSPCRVQDPDGGEWSEFDIRSPVICATAKRMKNPRFHQTRKIFRGPLNPPFARQSAEPECEPWTRTASARDSSFRRWIWLRIKV